MRIENLTSEQESISRWQRGILEVNGLESIQALRELIGHLTVPETLRYFTEVLERLEKGPDAE